MKFRLCCVVLMVTACVGWPALAFAQKVSVKSATPASGPQGATGLNVTVAGSGFSPGDRVDFFKSGTTDPAGLKVNKTTYVSNTQLVANIDISDGAAVAYFDVQVTSSSRSGKGTDLFSVTSKSQVCIIPETDPAHFQLVGTFNSSTPGGPLYSNYLGLSLGIGEASIPLPAGGFRSLLVVFSGSYGPGTVEVFFVDPNTGSVIDGVNESGLPVQPHITAALPYTSKPFTPWVPDIEVADLNDDGVPDAVAADDSDVVVAGLLSRVSGDGVISYSVIGFPLPPTGGFSFGQSLAIGDLDGVPGLEIAVVQKDQSTRSVSSPARVYTYRFLAAQGTFQLVSTMTPSLQSGDNFGNTIAVGDVTGDGKPDLIGGAPHRTIGKATSAGAVLVFPGTGSTPPYTFSSVPLVLTLASPLKYDEIGHSVMVGNTDSDPLGQVEVLTLSGQQLLYNPVAPPIRGVVFRGPVTALTKETPSDSYAPPSAPLGKDWGLDGNWTLIADVDQNGLSDVLVSAPNADVTSTCTSTGTVYVFFAQADGQGRFAGWRRTQMYQPPTDVTVGDFGWSLAAADRWHLLFIGDTQRTVGGVPAAGQIYVYRVY